MFKQVSGILLAAVIPTLVTAQPVTPTTIKHVIYVTFDGTRWQDIYNDKRLPIFMSKYGERVEWYGVPNTNRTIQTASIPISMPSYQSQTSGYVQPCLNNECPRIEVETMQERLIKEFNFDRKTVATIAGWPVITNSVESTFGVTFSNCGNEALTDPDTHVADEVMQKLNDQQAADQPSDHNRWDKYTAAHALHYFEVYQPKFLWISLTDADDAAHAANLTAYRASFDLYDDFLDKLFNLLEKLNRSADTMVIVTTDHGRGNGKYWTSHGPQFPESKRTWGFVYNGELKPIGQDGPILRYSTLSIRPTVENALLGR